MERQCRLPHRRASGQHEHLAFEKPSQMAVELIDTGTDLQLLACPAAFLFLVNLAQHPLAHFSGRTGRTVRNKLLLQLLQILVRRPQQPHNIGIRTLCLADTHRHFQDGLPQHPATDHPGGIGTDKTGVAHLQHPVGDEAQPVQPRGTQHIDIRLMLVKRQHRPVHQAVIGMAEHLRTKPFAHFTDRGTLCHDRQDNGKFHLFGNRCLTVTGCNADR